MNRRSLLLGASGLALATALTACGTSVVADIGVASSYINAIAGALSPFQDELALIPTAGPFIKLAIEYAPKATAAANSIASAASGAAALPFAQQVQAEVKALVDAETQITGIPSATQTEVQMVLSAMETAANAAVSILGGLTLAGAEANGPKVDDAIATLKKFAAKGRR